MSVVVLLETGSNQRYLFETNKLAEVIGASELISQATTSWVTDAIAELTEGAGPSPYRVLLQSSGKTLVLADDDTNAADLVFAVTSRGLVEAPGLRLLGARSQPFDWSHAGALHRAIGDAHRTMRNERPTVAPAEQRFLRLPVVAECRSSGLPAAVHSKILNEPAARSLPILAKLDAAPAGAPRLRASTGASDGQPAAHLGELEELLIQDSERWIGIVHADGNGLGEVFLAFDAVLHRAGLDPDDNETYARHLLAFSQALEHATDSAIAQAIEATWSDHDSARTLPFVPLVIGGDDLTVITAGPRVLAFARSFVESFLQQTQAADAITKLVPSGIGMSAGIAITKPHHPFWAGYQLAEELIDSAKQVKHRVTDSAGPSTFASVDLHVLFESSVRALDSIRSPRPDGSLTFGGPYVVQVTNEAGLTNSSKRWLAHHRIGDLEAEVESLCAEVDGQLVLPSSQTHTLRTAALRSRDEADRSFTRFRDRYGAAAERLSPSASNDTLHWDEGDAARTRLIDAMSLADLTRAEEAP